MLNFPYFCCSVSTCLVCFMFALLSVFLHFVFYSYILLFLWQLFVNKKYMFDLRFGVCFSFNLHG